MLKFAGYILGALVLIAAGGFVLIGLSDTAVPQQEIIIDVNAGQIE